MGSRNVNGHFAAVLRSAGLPHQRFDDLRHGCATFMLVQGQNLKVVQQVLGHTSIATTGNVYAHVLMGLKTPGRAARARRVSPRQPRITAAQLLRALRREGWEIERQRGGHAQLAHPTKAGLVTVPRHTGEILKPKTLAAILDQAGLSVDDLRPLL